MLQLIEYSAADDAVVAVVAELLEAAAVDGERLEAVAAVGSTAGHVSVAVAVGIHKTDNPVLLHWPSVQKSSHPFSMLNAKFFHCNIMAMFFPHILCTSCAHLAYILHTSCTHLAHILHTY